MSPHCIALKVAVLLVTTPSVLHASAFIVTLNSLPSAAHHRTIHHHSTVDSIIINEHNNDSTVAQIGQTLQELEKNYLANPSKLQPILEQHKDDDREPTPNELVKETLLSTRLPNLQLNRTCIGPSTIEGAGRGLFATEDIAKGELITCYPGDALLCDYSELEEEDDGEVDEEYNFDEEDFNFEDDEYDDEESDYVEEIVLWGGHVDTADRLDEDEVFDGIIDEDLSPLTSYAASVDDVYSVMGMSILDNDPAYYGHFANDGAGHIALQTGVDDATRIGIEEIISSYVSESVELSNAIHRPIAEGLHLGTVATKAIKKGEEVMVTYGTEYWIDFQG